MEDPGYGWRPFMPQPFPAGATPCTASAAECTKRMGGAQRQNLRRRMLDRTGPRQTPGHAVDVACIQNAQNGI
jgi:hypothetical protein